MLQSKQEVAIAKIESLMKSPARGGGLKRWKMPFLRASLDNTIRELRTWQADFDTTWISILTISHRLIDEELSGFHRVSMMTSSQPNLDATSFRPSTSTTTLVSAGNLRKALSSTTASKIHVSLPESGLDWDQIKTVPYSSTKIVNQLGSTKRYALNTIDCSSDLDLNQVRTDAESLARKLNQVDSDAFGLLAAYGLVKRRETGSSKIQSLNLVFSLPIDAHEPSSLRQDLMRPQTFSLSRIVDLARRLAQATSLVHTCDFVHKNIRPETIITFGDISSIAKDARNTYLLGLDSFRNVNFNALRKGDAAWERDLYRHPSRQGLRAHNKYVMQHDVYSLGVCLLEIGLWASFVEYEHIEEATGNSHLKPNPSAALGLEVGDFEPKVVEATNSYDHIKDHLVTLARSRLPPRMGDKYTSVVITCLTCLDEGNEDFGDDQEMQDEDGILVGVRFIEKVLFRLSEISF
ncbi:hypothetical protein E8E14_003445 [Neopestalotiopsis sp. 37M]|nr:hypothetical protein E8E14_003445 [Neopestalotiopsis sp. 37M]